MNVYVPHCPQTHHGPFTVSTSRKAFHDLIFNTAVHITFEDWNRVILEKPSGFCLCCDSIGTCHTNYFMSPRQIQLLIKELAFWNFCLVGVKKISLSALRDIARCLYEALRAVLKTTLTVLFPLSVTVQDYSSAMLPDLCEVCPHIIGCLLIVLWMPAAESWFSNHW